MKAAFIFLLLLADFCLAAQPERSINYLNQKSPGQVARIFAPGLVSTGLSEHSAPAFSPDGSIVIWTVMDKNYRGYLMEMEYRDGSWSKPSRPSFADTTADDFYASFSIDGKKLFFSSRRKVPAGYIQGKDISIWEVDRNHNGWGKPVPFDTTVSQGHDYAHSVSGKGTLYFSSAPGAGTNMNIKMSEKINGHYIKPALLPFNINSVDYEDGPYIAPDESFLIFESQRPGGIGGSLDLYISFKNNGSWGIPVNMGPKINSASSERFARLSPDGKYLFFGSGRNMSDTNWGFDIYWIEATVLDELKNNQTAKEIIDESLGDAIIDALDKNEIAKSSGLMKDWLTIYPANLDACVIYSSILRKQQRYAEAEQLLSNNEVLWNNNRSIILEKALIKFAFNKDGEAIELLKPVLVQENQLRENYLHLSNALFEMSRFELSDEYFEKAMALGSHGVFWYNRACGYAHIGRKDNAFYGLYKAVGLGYNSRRAYEGDPDLEPLKTDTRWKALLEKLQ
jgi:hypothetical protein